MSTDWKVVHEIKGESGHAIRVQRRGDQRPQYSFQIGRERRPIEGSDEPPEERLLPFVQLRFNSGVLDREALSLVQRALDWVESDAKHYVVMAAEPLQRRRSNDWSGSTSILDLQQQQQGRGSGGGGGRRDGRTRRRNDD